MPCTLRSLVALGLALVCTGAFAQRIRPARTGFDTAYVHDYSHIVTGRFYLSTKFNRMRLGGSAGFRDLLYLPNNKFNFGFGASYRALTLNIGVGIPVLNRDQDRYGTTKYIDAQANLYTKRWATNLFLQRFSGYYIGSHTKAEIGFIQPTEFPTRRDLVQFNVGASSVHIFNNDRFSYRASFNQDAWQRKSQGSWLLGGYATYFQLRSDSSLVPDALSDQFEPGLHMRRGTFWDVGPSGGYAYTLVMKEHWFITGSAVLGAGASFQRVETETPLGERGTIAVTGPGWHAQFRAGGGYNSEHRYFGISWNQENIGYLLAATDRFSWSVGNLRVNFVQRFNRRSDRMDKGLRWFRKKVQDPLQEALPVPKE
ncbi:MAG TPA: DUF4421 domain-containing protein [Flavobacteriales bacterium]